ncbi:TonB-dependent receptor [Catalinimonas niigatensis]|uniref:TonB-dependent receptor n=1 Tax=Catalinimonas niigatensis TaxID=1397264 RepID=UPI002666417F|nr:TonB-dependent receptor [Catalinimonas niigatensis]WPP51191.1 TonB-dependent receptor [Catalinimonas niigatensis]
MKEYHLHIFLGLLLFIIMIPFDSQSQNLPQLQDSCQYQVEGFIIDLSTKEALPFATVQVKGTNKGAIANEGGFFSIDQLCQKEFDLVVSHVGYKKVTHHHDTYHQHPRIYLAPDSVTLESVIVEGELQEGELYSGTVNKLSTQQFEQNQSESLGDLASNISGVSVLRTGQNVVKPIIHGLHSNRVLIVNNGVRHEFQNWGVEHAPEIDPSMADNISVVKGAATVRYGPDALGGVLVINPNKLELLTPIQGEVNLIGKSNGRSTDGHIRLQKGFHKLSLQGQASFVYQGDLHAPDYVLSNTGKREQSLSFGSRYHWQSFDFYAYYSHFNQELGILRGSVTGNLEDMVNAIESSPPPLTGSFGYEINNPRQVVNHDVFKLKGLWNGEEQSLEVVYALQMNHRQEFDVRRGTNNERPSIDLELMSQTLDLEWKHPSFKSWDGSMGMQAIYQDNNNIPGTNTVSFIPNFNNSRIGFYLIEGKEIIDSRVEWGLRYDFQSTSIVGREPDNDIYRNQLSFQNVTATLGLVKLLQNGHSFRTNLGTAWRPPNVSEPYSFGKHQASIEYGLWRYRRLENNVINTDEILTERDKAVASEMGIKWINTYDISQDQLQAEFTAYVNLIKNYFYTKPAGITQTIRGAFPLFVYDQDDALFAGIDASVHYKHTPKITSSVMMSYLWAKNVSNNEYFVGLPPANIQYTYVQALPKFAFFDESQWNIDFNYTLHQFQAPRVISVREILNAQKEGINLFAENDADFDFLAAPDAYLLANVGWSGRINQFSLGFQVRNLLNTTYRTYTDRLRYFADDIGRNFILKLNYQF